MGLIKAGIGAAGGVLADSWREYFYCDSLEADVLCAKGQKRISDKGRSSNTKGESNIISNGSIIAVNEGQFMIIVEQGAIVDACGEAGEFVFDKSTEPSLFFGESGTLGDRIKKSFERVGARFSFGGDTGKDQRVYFFNAKEIVGNKYGTAQPVPFRVVDANIGLDVDISVRCNGEYSYKIVDPLMFYKNVCGNVEEPYTRDKIDSQLKSELLTALQPAFAKISAMGVRYSAVPAHTTELADALNEVLSEKWGELRGLKVASFGVNAIAASEEDEQMIKRPAEGRGHARPEHGGRQSGGFAGRCYAHGRRERERCHDGIHGHGYGQRGGRHEPAGPLRPGRQRPAKPVSRGGGRRLRGAYPEPAATAAPAAAPTPEPAAAAAPAAAPAAGGDAWTCSCGASNTGKFCSNCGSPSPCRPRPPVSGSARAVRRTPASSAVTAVAPSPQATAAGIASAASTAPARSAATAARSARKAAYARRAAGLRSARAAFVGPAGN